MLKLLVGDPKRGGLAVARAAALIIHRIITIITITVSHSLYLSSFLLSSSLGGAVQGIHLQFDPATAAKRPSNLQAFHDAYHPRVFVKCDDPPAFALIAKFRRLLF